MSQQRLQGSQGQVSAFMLVPTLGSTVAPESPPHERLQLALPLHMRSNLKDTFTQ